MMFLYTFMLFTACVSTKVDGFMIQLRPEQILQSFQSMITSDFLRTLANEFAKKAADHLINEMKNQEKQFTLDSSPRVLKSKTDSTLIDKDQVLTLLRDPSPDGDNLEAELVLSEEEIKTTKDNETRAPMKINGAYFKRFFG